MSPGSTISITNTQAHTVETYSDGTGLGQVSDLGSVTDKRLRMTLCLSVTGSGISSCTSQDKQKAWYTDILRSICSLLSCKPNIFIFTHAIKSSIQIRKTCEFTVHQWKHSTERGKEKSKKAMQACHILPELSFEELACTIFFLRGWGDFASVLNPSEIAEIPSHNCIWKWWGTCME